MTFNSTTLLSSQLHDIKNEMQAILSLQDELAELLTELPEQATILTNISKHSESLNQRLVELLSVLKIQNTSFAPNENENWLIDTITPIVNDQKRLKQFAVIPEFDLEFNQFYDEQLVAIALNNIFGNAHQAGATEARVKVEEFNDGHWLIEIVDNGPGFKPEQLLKGEFNPQGTASGLGLYLIQQAIKTHKRNGNYGSITLENHSNGGAMIKLVFP
ncbi:MAG: K+-sensing histidine kinase KdpD [Bermanella sp.]|jgi:K+-sensing histidine kinase KdpD